MTDVTLTLVGDADDAGQLGGAGQVHLVAYRWAAPAGGLHVTGCTCGRWALAGTVNGADAGHDRHVLGLIRAVVTPVTYLSPDPSGP